MKDMWFEKVSFNVEFVLSLTKKEFLSHIGQNQLWPELSPKDRQKRLSEVYDLIQYANNPKYVGSTKKN